MRTFTIESNGRLDRTTLYLNGEQISGVREVFVHINEDGSFDGIIEYQGTDSVVHTKQLFADYLDNLKVVPPSVTEEEAQSLHALTVESSGEIESTMLYYNDAPLEGVVDLLLHVRKGTNTSSAFASLIRGKKSLPEDATFQAEIMFRNEDESLELERLFA